MKTYYLVQVDKSRFQVKYVTPKKIRLFDEYAEDPVHLILFVIFRKQRIILIKF